MPPAAALGGCVGEVGVFRRRWGPACWLDDMTDGGGGGGGGNGEASKTGAMRGVETGVGAATARWWCGTLGGGAR